MSIFPWAAGAAVLYFLFSSSSDDSSSSSSAAPDAGGKPDGGDKPLPKPVLNLDPIYAVVPLDGVKSYVQGKRYTAQLRLKSGKTAPTEADVNVSGVARVVDKGGEATLELQQVINRVTPLQSGEPDLKKEMVDGKRVVLTLKPGDAILT